MVYSGLARLTKSSVQALDWKDSMTVTQAERQEILSEVQETWNDLIKVIDSFSDEELETPNVIGIWSLKDLLGHLETWDRIAIRKIDLASEGIESPWWQLENRSFNDIDAFNEADADENRHRTIDELRSEMNQRHRKLESRILSAPVLTRELIAVDTCDHYRDHLADIRAWQSNRT